MYNNYVHDNDKTGGCRKMTLIYNEIDGTVTRINAVEADEGFLHLPAGAMDACFKKGYHLYKGDNGEYYLADQTTGEVAAVTMPLIATYIRIMIMK